MLVEVVGDSLCCEFIFRKGGSQRVDSATGELLITDVLLAMLRTAARCGFTFRWVPRELVQDLLSDLLRALGPWEVGALASPSNTTVSRFYAPFDSTSADGFDAFTQDWSGNALFILPDLHRIDQGLEKVERDDAEVVMVVPEWTAKRLWARLDSGPWRRRIVRRLFIATGALVANNEQAFFSRAFMTRHFAFRTGAGAARAWAQRP